MPTTDTGPALQVTRAQRFAEYIRPAVVAAGYDIDSPRGGGKKALAEATGMSPSSVGRMLAGQTLPEPVHLERLAEALGVSLMDLLVRSGVVSEKAGRTTPTPAPVTPDTPLTPEAAARALGIRSPDRVQMFAAMAKTLADQDEADNGVRAGKGA